MAEAKGIDSSLDSFARIVSNAPLCLRGSQFGSAGFPCPVARRHMSIRIQILFDVGLHLDPTSRSRSSDPGHEQRSRSDRHESRRDDRRGNRREDTAARSDRDRSDNRDDRRHRRD